MTMNIKKILLILAFGLSINNLHGMEKPEPERQRITAYFLPQDHRTFDYVLYSALDNAKKEVLVAMYWLTHQPMINHLIRLKERGVKVKIIIDNHVSKNIDLNKTITLLLKGHIVPLVSSHKKNSMHNKFVIIDGTHVFTGSANFTGSVLGARLNARNDENVIEIFDDSIALQYKKAFNALEDKIIESYVGFLLNFDPSDIESWITDISRELYITHSKFGLKLHQSVKISPGKRSKIERLLS